MSDIKVNSLTPEEAWKLFHDEPSSLLVDIRSSMEHLFVGHPTGSIHVPWIDEPDWVINPDFVTEIRKLMLGGVSHEKGGTSIPVILICRSGKRSREAAQVLIEVGIDNIYHINEGFEGDLDENHHRSTTNGWRFRGLPWDQC